MGSSVFVGGGGGRLSQRLTFYTILKLDWHPCFSKFSGFFPLIF